MGKWLQRRWLEFRWGWLYISYILSLINFITITYYLLLENIGIGIPIWLYTILVVTIVPLITISIGHFYHRRHQLDVDVSLTLRPVIKRLDEILNELRKIEGRE